MMFCKVTPARKANALVFALTAILMGSCASSTGGKTIQLQALAQSQNCDVPESKPYWLHIQNRTDLPATFSAVKHSGPYWLVGLGDKPTGGYSINVAPQARLLGAEIQVGVVTSSPQGRIVSQAFTNPCVLLAAVAASGITNSRWLENGNEQIVPVQAFSAAAMQQSWQ